MDLFIIRHADPNYEQDTITPYGEKEAEQLARRLQRTGLDLVFSSPMGRAQATARITCERLGLEYRIEEWAHEVDLHINTPSGRRVWISEMGAKPLRNQRVLDKESRWYELSEFAEFSGQAVFDYVARSSDQFLQKLGYRREEGYYRVLQENRQKVALFCHGGLSLTWLSHLWAQNPLSVWAGFHMHTTGVTHLRFGGQIGDAIIPQCRCHSDISHLYAANMQQDDDTPPFAL